MKSYRLVEDKEQALNDIHRFEDEWNQLDKTGNTKTLDLKFNKVIDALYKKLDINKQEAALIKYNNKLERLINDDNEDSLDREVQFVKRRIDELKTEILQLERNLAYFGKIDEKNPLVRDVIRNINHQKEHLKTWENKLRELKNLQKSQEAEATAEEQEGV